MNITKSLRRAVVRQFGRPSGALGHVAGLIMEHRPSNRERNIETLRLLAIKPEDRVLEIGFGPGVALSRAAELASRGHVLGVDHSKVMVDRATRRNAAAIARGRMDLRLQKARDLSLEAASIDKAYAVNVFMFWSDPESVLRRVRRCLRPGGRLAITHQPRNAGAVNDDTRKDAERIVVALDRAGFEAVQVEVLRMRPVDAVCVLARVPEPKREGQGESSHTLARTD